jgi:hypothetical protein
MYRLVALGVVSLVISGCLSVPQRESGAPLSAEEVRRLFIGNTVESYNLNTRLYSFTYYFPNGQAIQERLWSKRLGRWELRDDGQICLAFNKRELKCRHIIREGKRYFKIRPDASGKPEKIVRYRYFAPGNALAKR